MGNVCHHVSDMGHVCLDPFSVCPSVMGYHVMDLVPHRSCLSGGFAYRTHGVPHDGSGSCLSRGFAYRTQ